MNRIFSVCFFLVGTFLTVSAQSVTVMTYNIRLDVASDGENAWPLRKEYLVDQIKFYSPDIFGIQEGTPDQTKYLKEQLTAYSYIGVGRDGDNKGEYSAIFYNTKKFSVAHEATFWLSSTPDKVSMGWDAACNRICTYGLFTNKETHEKLWFFNTHLDHVGVEARTKGVALIKKKMAVVNTDAYPVVLTGDFNLEPDSAVIHEVKEYVNDSKEVAKNVVFGPSGTFNGFDFFTPVTKRIDYIFVSKNKVKVSKYAVLSDSKDLKYPSDHLPVYVELELHK